MYWVFFQKSFQLILPEFPADNGAVDTCLFNALSIIWYFKGIQEKIITRNHEIILAGRFVAEELLKPKSFVLHDWLLELL